MSFQPLPLHVVELDRPHDRRRLRRAVAVRPGGVVYHREPETGRERRAPRRIFSSAFQPLRGTIPGAPAFCSVRDGTPSAGLQTKCARSRETVPLRKRYSIRFEGPTHHGLPSRQVPARARSGVPASGRSSASGAASTQPLQRPVSERVLNCTVPGPRQCSPTRLNSPGVSLPQASAHCGAARRATIVASAAAVGTGKARTTTAMRRRRLGKGVSPQRVAAHPFADKSRDLV